MIAVTATRNGVTRTLADGIGYLPFGPAAAMTLGNGITMDRCFDQQYRMTGNLTTGVQDLGYGHDPVGNVTTVTDTLDPARNLAFGYDDLYRLTGATGIYGSLGFTMDDTGNRLTRTDGGPTTTYTYTTGTNRLDLITNGSSVDIVTDAAGNTVGYGDRTLAYTQANRLAEVQENGITLGAYVTSADGRRMKKTVEGQVTVYHYDTAGNLIGESDGQGNLTRLYVYLNGVPLAEITMDGSTESTCYYHNDHLGTPLKMTDAAGTIVWAADYKPFGNVNITVETVENNLRFAGQYFDAETGLNYNYHRYYDPATGRYLTPDPIGLEGGINLYIYVQNNPVNFLDPNGLFGFAGAASGAFGGFIGGLTVGYVTTDDLLGAATGTASGTIIGGVVGLFTGPQGGFNAGTIGSGIVTGVLGELSGPTETGDTATQRLMDSGEWWGNESYLQDVEDMLNDPIWDKFRENKGPCE